MRVEIVVTCVLADSWRILRVGETHDLPDDQAQSLISGGLARLVEDKRETASVAAPETATMPIKRKRE